MTRKATVMTPIHHTDCRHGTASRAAKPSLFSPDPEQAGRFYASAYGMSVERSAGGCICRGPGRELRLFHRPANQLNYAHYALAAAPAWEVLAARTQHLPQQALPAEFAGQAQARACRDPYGNLVVFTGPGQASRHHARYGVRPGRQPVPGGQHLSGGVGARRWRLGGASGAGYGSADWHLEFAKPFARENDRWHSLSKLSVFSFASPSMPVDSAQINHSLHKMISSSFPPRFVVYAHRRLAKSELEGVRAYARLASDLMLSEAKKHEAYFDNNSDNYELLVRRFPNQQQQSLVVLAYAVIETRLMAISRTLLKAGTTGLVLKDLAGDSTLLFRSPGRSSPELLA